MIDGKFDVVFRGQTIKSLELDQVKNNLAALFKTSPEAIEKLFTGLEVVVRKGLDYSSAMKYQAALKNAGALALIKEVESSKDESQSKANTDPGVTQSEQAEQTSSKPSSDMSLAAVGSQLLPDKIYEKREVDTSSLSLAAAGERLLPPKPPQEFEKPSIDHLKLE